MIQYDKMLEQKKIVLRVNVECTYICIHTCTDAQLFQLLFHCQQKNFVEEIQSF